MTRQTSLKTLVAKHVPDNLLNQSMLASHHFSIFSSLLYMLFSSIFPALILNSDSLRTYFSKFGHVEGVVTKPAGKPVVALITFSTHVWQRGEERRGEERKGEG